MKEKIEVTIASDEARKGMIVRAKIWMDISIYDQNHMSKAMLIQLRRMETGLELWINGRNIKETIVLEEVKK